MTPRLGSRLPLAAALAALAAPAWASDAGDEITVGRTRPVNASTSDSSTFVSNSAIASFDLGEAWTLDPGFIWSQSRDTYAATASAPASSSSSTTWLGTLLASFSPTDNWLFLASAKYSPAAGSPVSIPMPLRGFTATDEYIRSFSTGLSAAYDTAGDGDFEWGVDLDPSFTSYGIRFVGRNPEGVHEDTQWLSLQQYRLGAGATLHLFDRADVGVKGAYDFYADRLATNPDLLIKHLGQATGGLPIAPMRLEVGPTVAFYFTHRWYLSLAATAGPYVDPCQGGTLFGTLKLTGKPKPFRFWGALTLQWDTPPQDPGVVRANSCNGNQVDGTPAPPSLSSYFAVGAEYVW